MFRRITAATLVLCGMMTAQRAWADTTISLQDAVRQGKVKVDVKSRGGATGPTVRVEVQRLAPEALTVEVVPGTVLINSVNAEQNVAVGQLKGEFTGENKYRPGQVMVLADSQTRSFLLEVYCLDHAKKAPRKGGPLQLASQDQRVRRLLSPPAGVQPTLAAVQIAIWMDRSGITAAEARRRFRGATTEVDVQVARQLLAHAEQTGVATIPDDMPASLKVHVSQLFSSQPGIRDKAAAALGQLGAEALPAVSLLAENLLDRSSDKPLPASVAPVSVGAALGDAAQALEQLGWAELAPLVDSLREGASALEQGTGGTVPAVEGTVRAARGMVSDLLVDGLLMRLKNERAVVRRRAAQVLGTLGSTRAIAPLIDVLEDEDAQVRETAAQSLQALTGQPLGGDAQAWRKWLQSRPQ